MTGHAHLGGDITDTGRGQGRVPFRLYSFMGGETQTLSLSATYLRGQDVCKAQRDYKNERGRAQRRRVCVSVEQSDQARDSRHDSDADSLQGSSGTEKYVMYCVAVDVYYRSCCGPKRGHR